MHRLGQQNATDGATISEILSIKLVSSLWSADFLLTQSIIED